MSMAAAMRFLIEVRRSPEMKRELAAIAGGDEPMARTVELASAMGFDLSGEELRNILAKEWQMRWLRYGAASPPAQWRIRHPVTNNGKDDD